MVAHPDMMCQKWGPILTDLAFLEHIHVCSSLQQCTGSFQSAYHLLFPCISVVLNIKTWTRNQISAIIYQYGTTFLDCIYLSKWEFYNSSWNCNTALLLYRLEYTKIKKKTAQTEVTDNKDHRKFPVNLPHLYEYYTDISVLFSKHVTQPQNFLS